MERLRLRYVRIEPSPNWAYYAGKIPPGMTLDQFRGFAARKFETDWKKYSRRLRKFHGALTRREIKVFWVMYQLPFNWLIGKQRNRLSPAHHDDYLHMWLSQLSYYRSKGVVPYAIEMANEPDGWWNGRMTAADYHRLATRFRALLDQHGFRDVKIGGPGLSSLNLYHDNGDWIADMPDDAFAALDFFTMHGWDEVLHPGAGLNFMRGQWVPFKQATLKRDPNRTRRVILTEFSSEVTHFGGKGRHSPRSRALYSAMESPAFALRVTANALMHLNHGVSVPMIWRLSDHVQDKTTWGLIAAKPRRYKRPAFFHLEKMIAPLQPGARIHPGPNQRRDNIAMLFSTREGRASLRAVNLNNRAEKVKFQPPNPREQCRCRSLVGPGKGRPACRPLPDNIFELTIPEQRGILCDFP